MITEQAIVQSHNAVANTVVLELQRASSCSKCSANKSCGVGLINGVLGQDRNTIEIPTTSIQSLQAGQTVDLNMQEHSLISASLLLYGLPLFMLIIGVVAGHLFSGEIGALLGAVLGLLLAIPAVRLVVTILKSHQQYMPILINNA